MSYKTAIDHGPYKFRVRDKHLSIICRYTKAPSSSSVLLTNPRSGYTTLHQRSGYQAVPNAQIPADQTSNREVMQKKLMD